MKILTFTNNKGGVAKTTSVRNVVAKLVEKGYKVLNIDLDPQANLTQSYGIPNEIATHTVYDIIKTKQIKPYIIQHTENLHIIPSNLFLEKSNAEFITYTANETLLKRVLKEVENDYDICVIDTAPNLGLLTKNAVASANSVYIPMQAGYFELRGASLLIDMITEIQEVINNDVRIKGMFITRYDARTNLGQAVIDEIEGSIPGVLLDTKIRNNIALGEAPANGLSIFEYDAKSNGAKDYKALTEEILIREGLE